MHPSQKNKSIKEVVQVCIDNVYAKPGGSTHILLCNGKEFKNNLFTNVAKQLGMEYNISMSPTTYTEMAEIE